jgi:hypothetical protein
VSWDVDAKELVELQRENRRLLAENERLREERDEAQRAAAYWIAGYDHLRGALRQIIDLTSRRVIVEIAEEALAAGDTGAAP